MMANLNCVGVNRVAVVVVVVVVNGGDDLRELGNLVPMGVVAGSILVVSMVVVVMTTMTMKNPTITILMDSAMKSTNGDDDCDVDFEQHVTKQRLRQQRPLVKHFVFVAVVVVVVAVAAAVVVDVEKCSTVEAR